MDFQIKTHFGALHHGPKAHFYQTFHSKTAKTESMHNWGKKKKILQVEILWSVGQKLHFVHFRPVLNYFE